MPIRPLRQRVDSDCNGHGYAAGSRDAKMIDAGRHIAVERHVDFDMIRRAAGMHRLLGDRHRRASAAAAARDSAPSIANVVVAPICNPPARNCRSPAERQRPSIREPECRSRSESMRSDGFAISKRPCDYLRREGRRAQADRDFFRCPAMKTQRRPPLGELRWAIDCDSILVFGLIY